MKRRLLKISQQTFWQILGKIVTSLSTFIVLGLVARNYGEEGTGVFTLALTYLAIFYLLSDFGFNAHVLRRIKNHESRIKGEWRKLLGARIMWSGVLIILALSLLPLLPFADLEFSKAVIFASLAILGSAIFVTCNLVFQSRLKYNLSSFASSIGTILGLSVFVYMASFRYPISLLLVAHLMGWLIIALTALLLIKKVLQIITPIFDKQYTVSLFRQSWPIAATLALNVVYFRADSFIISYFRSYSEVGIYNLAYSVFQTALVVPTFIMNAYYPLMLKSFSGIKLVGLGLLALSSIGAILTITLSPLMIEILTGGGFAGSTQSLQILSLGFPAYFLSALFMWIFVSKGEYKKILMVYASGLILNLSLNFLYIPNYSFMAASWITVLSEYFILIMLAVVLFSQRR